MNKAELVQAMADDAGLSKSDAEKALNAFVEIVGGELGKGGKVQLVGFGTFEVTERAARVGKNRKGVQLASGQSVTVFKQILQNLGYNPVEAMENTINSERYDCITVE